MHLKLAVQYTNQRQQFKTPISAFNLTKEKLATMASKIYAAESSFTVRLAYSKNE